MPEVQCLQLMPIEYIKKTPLRLLPIVAVAERAPLRPNVYDSTTLML